MANLTDGQLDAIICSGSQTLASMESRRALMRAAISADRAILRSPQDAGEALKTLRNALHDGYPHEFATLRAALGVPAVAAPSLAVWFGPMPESNGKANWTAILHRDDISASFTIERSEHHDRVRYEADRVRYLIGELAEEPDILAYDANMLSPAGWVHPCGVKACLHRPDESCPNEAACASPDGCLRLWPRDAQPAGPIKFPQDKPGMYGAAGVLAVGGQTSAGADADGSFR